MLSANFLAAILFYYYYVTMIVHVKKMAVIRDTDCYVFGDNLEAVLETLEEDHQFETDLTYTGNKSSIF